VCDILNGLGLIHRERERVECFAFCVCVFEFEAKGAVIGFFVSVDARRFKGGCMLC
jgi:hypothetical protein